MRDPFGLAGRAARVQEVEEVLGVHLLGRALGRLVRDELVEPVVAPLGERVLVAAPPHGDHVFDARTLHDRGVRVVLQRDDGAAPPSAVGGDQHLRLRVVDAVAERLGAESAEDHGVRRADLRAREHRDRQLGNHPQVDVHAVALADAEAPQSVRQPADLVQEIAVGEHPGVAGLALPVERDLVATPRLHVAVEEFTDALSCPPANQVTHGAFQSITESQGRVQVSRPASAAQKASWSRFASS